MVQPIRFLFAFELGVLFLCAPISWGTEIDPAHSNIQYLGRWDQTNPSKPWCAWQSSAMRFNIKGTALAAVIESDCVEYIRVIVDQDSFRSKKLQLKPGKHSYELATNLTNQQHQIEVVKETYSEQGRLAVRRISIQGDGKLLPRELTDRLRIQFYGDSNLAGQSLEHEKNRGEPTFAGCHFTFAGIASRMLDADYQNISVGGAIILGQQNSLLSFYNRIDFYRPEPKWDFARFPADICVVNIGANDVGHRSKQEIKENYDALLRSLRVAHPKAHIVVMNAYGWDRNEPANYTKEVVDAFGDANMSHLVFPWLFNEWHGCEYDHAGMAGCLVEHLKTVNPEWAPVRQMDVMDGFGRNGDVANGSFESAAPFGGFGWRYFQDGALRVHDPISAADGEWFLRLPPGKQVHQPNPAAPNRTYTYSLKMRTTDDNGLVRLRVKFRDQKWRNEIKTAGKDLELNIHDKWDEYRIQVDSPSEEVPKTNAPWQVIFRIIAAKGSIDVDNVQLSSASPGS